MDIDRIEVFIVYDPSRPFLFHYLADQLINYVKEPIAITPVVDTKMDLWNERSMLSKTKAASVILILLSEKYLFGENFFIIKKKKLKNKNFHDLVNSLKEDFLKFGIKIYKYENRDEKEKLVQLISTIEKVKIDDIDSRYMEAKFLSKSKKVKDQMKIGYETYEVCDYLFNSKKVTHNDYIQLINIESGQIYLMKTLSNIHRNIKHKYPYIYTQYLGCEIAKKVGLKVQETKLLSFEGKDVLLILDVRANVTKMESIIYYNNRLDKKEQNYKKICQYYNEEIGREGVEFILKVMIFDQLIGNNQRDGWSLRFMEQETDQKIYDLLFENNFGSEYFSNTTPFCNTDIKTIYDLTVQYSLLNEMFLFLKNISLLKWEEDVSEFKLNKKMYSDFLLVLKNGERELKKLSVMYKRHMND